MMKKSIAGWTTCAALAVLAAVALPTTAYAQAQAQAQATAPAPAPTGPDGKPQTPAQRMYGDFNPKLAELTDEVLYADVWARPGLSPRDRSLATVSALIAMNRPDQLRSHLARARDNGVTEQELIETITHLAFYAGWPSAVSATAIAKDVFRKR